MVPGSLPFLIGRKLMRKAKLKIDFDNDFIEAQVAQKRLRQVGSAFLIALGDAETILQHVGASPQSNLAAPVDDDTNSVEQHAGNICSSEKIVNSATAECMIASQEEGSSKPLRERAGRSRQARNAGQITEQADRIEAHEQLTTGFATKHACSSNCCNALCGDINVFLASTHAEESVLT